MNKNLENLTDEQLDEKLFELITAGYGFDTPAVTEIFEAKALLKSRETRNANNSNSKTHHEASEPKFENHSNSSLNHSAKYNNRNL